MCHPERSPAEIPLRLRLVLLRQASKVRQAQDDTAGRSRTFAQWRMNGAKAPEPARVGSCLEFDVTFVGMLLSSRRVTSDSERDPCLAKIFFRSLVLLHSATLHFAKLRLCNSHTPVCRIASLRMTHRGTAPQDWHESTPFARKVWTCAFFWRANAVRPYGYIN